MQFILVIRAPVILILMIQLFKYFVKCNIGTIRIRPYPPSFNSTAAKIMEPSRGASTWALGNHKWKINMGIFTKKAMMYIKVKFILKQIVEEYNILKLFLIIRIPTRSGKEAVTVYKTKYIPAWSRSGWFPNFTIKIRVGTNTISNMI